MFKAANDNPEDKPTLHIGDIVKFINESVVVCAQWGDLVSCQSLRFGDNVLFYLGDFLINPLNLDLGIWVTSICTYPHSYFRR